MATHRIAVEELARHEHEEQVQAEDNHTYPISGKNQSSGIINIVLPSFVGFLNKTGVVNTKQTGRNSPHNNLQPSRATYIWCRTA